MQRHVSKIILCVEVDVTFNKEKCVVHNVDNLDVSEIESHSTNEYDYSDGMCDGYLNDAEHCFDGGDCCGEGANYHWCDSGCYPGMDCICECRA